MADAITNVKAAWKVASSPAAQGTSYRKGERAEAGGQKANVSLSQSSASLQGMGRGDYMPESQVCFSKDGGPTHMLTRKHHEAGAKVLPGAANTKTLLRPALLWQGHAKFTVLMCLHMEEAEL